MDTLLITELNEEEVIRNDIRKTLANLDRSWKNFSFAKQDYIDIAVMEIYIEEMKLGILLKKLKMMMGETVEEYSPNPCSREHFSWLEHA